jgi:membrane protein
VLLLWVYYSAQILFVGAEFTQVYANRFGGRIIADEGAVSTESEELSKEGMARPNPITDEKG